MNNFKPKLPSAGLGVVMLFGAVAPLTAAAAQTNTPQIQATVTTASAKADMGAMVPTLPSQRPVAGDGQNTVPSPAGQSQTQDGKQTRTTQPSRPNWQPRPKSPRRRLLRQPRRPIPAVP